VGLQSNDRLLVSRCLEGDEAAFTCLFSKHGKWVHAYAYDKVKDYQEAEDIRRLA